MALRNRSAPRSVPRPNLGSTLGMARIWLRLPRWQSPRRSPHEVSQMRTSKRNVSSITPRLPKTLAAAALVLGAGDAALAQYAPPPPLQPFPGFLNDWMRKQDPYLANWDISGSARFRYEVKENAGF